MKFAVRKHRREWMFCFSAKYWMDHLHSPHFDFVVSGQNQYFINECRRLFLRFSVRFAFLCLPLPYATGSRTYITPSSKGSSDEGTSYFLTGLASLGVPRFCPSCALSVFQVMMSSPFLPLVDSHPEKGAEIS